MTSISHTATRTAAPIPHKRNVFVPDYPAQLLGGVAWALTEPLPESYSDFKEALVEYVTDVGAEIDLNELHAIFPSTAIDVGSQYYVVDRKGKLHNRVAVASIRSKTKLTHGEILHMALLDISKKLPDSDAIYLEQFSRINYTLTEGVPVYEMFFGS